jgi:DNA-binding CsgD family transcriptional regulator
MKSDQQSIDGHRVKTSLNLSAELYPGQYDTFVELLDFFSDQPTFNEVSQFLVTHTFRQFNPWGACVAVTSHYDHMKVLGSFGLGEGLLRQYATTSFIGMPSEGEIIISGTPGLDESYWISSESKCRLCDVLTAHGPTALGLMSSHSTFSGFFQLLFLQPVKSPELIAKMEATLKILRVVINAQFQNNNLPFEALENSQGLNLRSNHRKNGDHSLEGAALTSRQQVILQHMADGKTNSAIARLIGFSESTVRQETIEIFRKVGVNDRRSAVTRAQESGILPPVVLESH